MYLISILLLTLVSIATSEPPVFGPPFNRELPAFGKYQVTSSSNRGPYDYYTPNSNGFKHPNLIYGTPGSSSHNHGGSGSNNHNHNNNNDVPSYIPFFPTHRPPVDSYGTPPNNNHFNPNGHPGYNYKPASYFRTGAPNGEARFEKPLFSPSNGLELAATSGQIDNFNKALQDEAQQLLRGQGHGQGQADVEPSTMFANGFTGFSNIDGPQQPPKTYVSVKFGQPNHQYQYEF